MRALKQRLWAVLFSLLLTIVSLFVIFPQAASASSDTLKVTLNPDTSNATVTAERLKPVVGWASTYTLSRQGSSYSGIIDYIGEGCDKGTQESTFNITAKDSTGKILGQSSKTICGIGDFNVTVAVNSSSSGNGSTPASTGEIHGQIRYINQNGNIAAFDNTASLTLVNQTTGQAVKSPSDFIINSSGFFTLSNVPSGTYKIEGSLTAVDSSGGSNKVINVSKSDIVVKSGQVTTLDIGVTADGKVVNGTELESQASDAGGSGESCESQSGVLGWILCPVVRMLDGAINFLDTQIQKLLTVPDPNNDARLHQTWAQLRNIALIILVPLMLVMIISTALGYEFFDAYTVKRALPRFAVAILFILLSWEITSFLIAFFNDIGRGVLGLLTNLFTSADSLAQVITPGQSAGAQVALFVGLTGAALGGFLSIGIIFSYALVTVVALLTGFLVLVMRQIVILALILLAPLAILAWIFPGNDKLWKFWWGTFSKLLLMFPMIMGLIAAGRIFASIIPFTGPLGVLVKITAYIAPFFFIPATFRFAGGVFATVSGMVNDRGRGFFDRSAKKRAESREAIHSRAGQGRRYNPTGILRGFNKTASTVADPLSAIRIKRGTSQGRALLSELTQKSVGQSQELAKWMSTAGFNQEALTEIMGIAKVNKGRVTKEGLDKSINDLETKPGHTAQDVAAAKQLRNMSAFLEETWRTEDYGRAHVGMAAGLAKAQQGFINSSKGHPEELAEYSNALNDFAPGMGDTFKTQAGVMNAQAGGLTKVGYSEQIGSDGRYIPGGTAARAIHLSRTSVQELAGAKSSQIKRHFLENGAMDAILNTDTSDGKEAQIVDSATGEHIEVNDARKEALLDVWAQAAYGYNTPAETAEVLRTKLNELKVGNVEQRVMTDKDGNVVKDRNGNDRVVEVATTQLGAHLLNSLGRATRDPSQFGGYDIQPPETK